VVVCSHPHPLLRGPTNPRLLRMAPRLCPGARVVVTANTLAGARSLYADGADFVFVPRIHSAERTARVILDFHHGRGEDVSRTETAALAARREVLG